MTDTSTRYLGWCPVCERDIKVRENRTFGEGDRLVHHGYQRPGHGYIVGDCFGVGYEPYELSATCCKDYLKLVLSRIEMYAGHLRVLESPRGPQHLYFENYDVETHRLIRNSSGHPATVKLTQDEADALARRLPSYEARRYSWEEALRRDTTQTRSLLDSWDREGKRVEQLIENWRRQPLRTFEEEIQRQEQSRAERETARSVARDEKISAEVVKIRKRIDSAVRNKNSAMLADIFSSTKLREVSGYRLTQDQAIALLERDPIWRAFGLLTPHGYLERAEAVRLLRSMKYSYPFPWPAELGGGIAKTR